MQFFRIDVDAKREQIVVLRRGRGLATLAAPAVAAALPLVYYYVLSHTDPAWSLASTFEATRRAPAITLIVGFGPLALIAAPGVRRPRGEMSSRGRPRARSSSPPAPLSRFSWLRPAVSHWNNWSPVR